MRFNFLMILLFLTGCHTAPITVQTEYLTHEHLASSYVQTPDPLQGRPFYGQRLIVSWSFPVSEFEEAIPLMHMKIRFRNREEQELKILLQKRSGTYIYDLMNEDFSRLGGILTYKIDVYEGDSLLACWRHQLWAELIVMDM
jgi:hypothetical protein